MTDPRPSPTVFIRIACALWLAVLAVVPVGQAAAQPAAEGAADQTVLPADPAEAMRFIATQDDATVRRELLRLLDERAGAPAPAGGEADMVARSREQIDSIRERLVILVRAIPNIPAAFATLFSWIVAPGSGLSALLLGGGVLAVGLGLGYVAETQARRWLDRRGAGYGPVRAILRDTAAALVFLIVALGATGAIVDRPGLKAACVGVILAVAVVHLVGGAFDRSARHYFAGVATDAALKLAGARLRTALSIVAVGYVLAGLMRDAGVDADVRAPLAQTLWVAFILCGFGFLQAMRKVVPRRADPGGVMVLDPVTLAIARHWFAFYGTFFAVVGVVSLVQSVERGGAALLDGLASILLFTAMPAVIAAIGEIGRSNSEGETEAEVRAEAPNVWRDTAVRSVRLIVFLAAWIGLASIWGVDPLSTANEKLGAAVASAVIDIAITVLLAYLAWEIVRTMLDARLVKATGGAAAAGHGMDAMGEEGGAAKATRIQTFVPLLRAFLYAVIIAVAIMTSLTAIGIDIGPLLAGAGVVGIAIGFGAQTLVRDIMSGVFFLLDDAFRLGEYVEIGSTRGTVEGISVRSMRLRHHRGAIHTVPFGEIQQLTNYSRDWAIIKLEFLLSFDTDLMKVKKIVKQIGKELSADPTYGPSFLEPLKSQGIRRMEQTGMVLGVKFTSRPGEQFVLRREVYQRVRDAFVANGITFARPEIFVRARAGSDVQTVEEAAEALPPEALGGAALSAVGKPPQG